MAKQNAELAVLGNEVKTLGREMGEIKTAVQEVHTIVTGLQISMATAPKSEHIHAIDSRVRSLENCRQKVSGGIKVITVIASGVGTVIGWAISHFSK